MAFVTTSCRTAFADGSNCDAILPLEPWTHLAICELLTPRGGPRQCAVVGVREKRVGNRKGRRLTASWLATTRRRTHANSTACPANASGANFMDSAGVLCRPRLTRAGERGREQPPGLSRQPWPSWRVAHAPMAALIFAPCSPADRSRVRASVRQLLDLPRLAKALKVSVAALFETE